MVPQNSNQMNLLYFYLFLCQGNIRHILYASVKTGRLKLSKRGEGTKMFHPPPHISLPPMFAWFFAVWSSRWGYWKWYDANIHSHMFTHLWSDRAECRKLCFILTDCNTTQVKRLKTETWAVCTDADVWNKSHTCCKYIEQHEADGEFGWEQLR